MKYLTHILALLCASAHLAMAMPPAPRATGRPFQIDGFEAQAYPEAMVASSRISYVEYNITLTPGEGNGWCWAWAEQPDFSIGDIPSATCQADNTVKWSFVKMADESYNFTVSWQYTGHGKLVGEWMIPSSQVQWITQGGVAVQQYVGPTSFTVSTKDVFGMK